MRADYSGLYLKAFIVCACNAIPRLTETHQGAINMTTKTKIQPITRGPTEGERNILIKVGSSL